MARTVTLQPGNQAGLQVLQPTEENRAAADGFGGWVTAGEAASASGLTTPKLLRCQEATPGPEPESSSSRYHKCAGMSLWERPAPCSCVTTKLWVFPTETLTSWNTDVPPRRNYTLSAFLTHRIDGHKSLCYSNSYTVIAPRTREQKARWPVNLVRASKLYQSLQNRVL